MAEEILTNKEDLEKIIWISEDPPEPGPEGMEYKFFYNTIEKHLYVYDESTQEWVTTQAPTPSLEEVLKVGSVADKGILLTDAEDALIALAPDEATLDIASDTEKKKPTTASYSY